MTDDNVQFYARMPKGMTLSVARARLLSLLAQLDRIHPKDGWQRTDRQTRVTGVTGLDLLQQMLPGMVVAFFAMLLIVVGLVR